MDVLHTRVVGRLEDEFQRKRLDWGHVQHRIVDNSGGGCHLGVYLDVLHTRVVGSSWKTTSKGGGLSLSGAMADKAVSCWRR